VIRKIVEIITLIGFSLFIGCEDSNHIEPIEFELSSGLEVDDNGYYHLTLDVGQWQTLHRIEGRVLRNGEGVNVIKFGWDSNMYWLLGDTLGHVIAHGLTDDLEYVGYDTTYITWFSGYEVPIVNGASYSDYDGYVSTMIAPVKSMLGDTATVRYGYHDNWLYENTYGEFNIIFD
jgi:hypothetical protein